MGFPVPVSPTPTPSNDDSPLLKRRRFEPLSLRAIQSWDNTSIEYKVFDSPLLQELSGQAPLPEEIEASLLQVGMRVRKAVPEGYKTLNTFRPRPFFNMRKLSPETQAALVGNQTRNELSPYYSDSNLHNVGGLPQPISRSTFCGINLDALAQREAASPVSWGSPGYSYEQSQMWQYSTSHKRHFNDSSDSEDSEDWLPRTPTIDADMGTGIGMPADYFAIDIEAMDTISPFAQARQPRTTEPLSRRVAKPISKIRKAQPQAQPASAFNPFASLDMMGEPQEQQQLEQPQQQEMSVNWGMDCGFGQVAAQPQPAQQPAATPMQTRHTRVLSCGVEASMMFGSFNDFGDAPFLARREDVEMDCS